MESRVRKLETGEYIPTIGIECHVQLKTKTKLFSGADNDARGKEPNTAVSPICFGLPGTLPVLNKDAVELAVRAGLTMDCEIARVSSFDRKHYFYPDLPKGYQITQLDRPTVGKGKIEVPGSDGSTFSVRINRAHMEEDAGKLTHPGGADYSLVDLNRAGTPLIEIVSEADMHSPEEAKAYVQELYLLMTYADVTNGDLYHGNMRFDVNVSVAKKDSGKLGTRSETKNLNSFKSVERAVEFEIKRQIELLEKGGTIKQETRGWDDAKQKTFAQRSKEEAQDYRYFPEADIPPIELTDEMIEEIRERVPVLPGEYRRSWAGLNLDVSVVNALLASRQSAKIVTDILKSAGDNAAKRAAHWFASAVSKSEDDGSDGIDKPFKGTTDQFSDLAAMAEKDEINSTAAKEIFNEIIKTGGNPRDIAGRNNLLQVSDISSIEAIVYEVLADPASKKAIDDLNSGNEKAIAYLIGQVMKISKGQANPSIAANMIKKKIEGGSM